jgi:hypothetical protein
MKMQKVLAENGRDFLFSSLYIVIFLALCFCRLAALTGDDGERDV